MKKIRVLFVCMGNICRSPTAHGVFEAMVKAEGLSDLIEVDSAGTHAYHVGEPPDPRSQETALARGVDLSTQRARRAVSEDFERFDYVIAMDRDNHQILRAICPQGREARLSLFLSFIPGQQSQDVPDPYFGGGKGFDLVFDLVEAASRGLLEQIRRVDLN